MIRFDRCLLFVALGLALSCVTAPVDVEKACDAEHPCGAGFSCLDNQCREGGCPQGYVRDDEGMCVSTACPTGQIRDGQGVCITCASGQLDSQGKCKVVCNGWIDEAGACQPKLNNGSTCTDAVQCGSGHCADGFCCDQACDSGCQTCGGSTPGTCVGEAANTEDPACGTYRCGADGSCRTSCSGEGDCQPDATCAANGTCVSARADGESCTADGQCANGHCVDQICCNTACAGSCDACGTGTCVPRPIGTGGVPACSTGYVCDGVNASCPTSCSASVPCANGFYCSGSACLAKKTDGVACGTGNECSSGNCVDGVCCNSDCAGACNACNLSGSLGKCALRPAGQEGSPQCGGHLRCNGTSTECPTTCGSELACDTEYTCAGGNCTYTCGPGSCASGQICCDTSWGYWCDPNDGGIPCQEQNP